MEYCDPCVLTLDIPDDSQAEGLTLRLYQHLGMFGVITGVNVSSTMTIRFATAGQAATALQAIRNPKFCSIVGAAVTVGYVPKKTHEYLKAQIHDLQHLLEERVLQQEVMARESERKITALCEELSLAHACHLEQSERCKLQLEDESKASASLRQQLEESLATQKSNTPQRIIDDMREELRDMDINLETRNKLVEEKDRQLVVLEEKFQRVCGELTSEVKQLEQALRDKNRQLEMLESLQAAEERKKREELDRNESETATRDNSIKVLHARIDELEERNKVLRGKVMDSDTRQLDLEVKLSASIADKVALEKQVKGSDTKVAVLEEKLAAGISEKKGLSADVAALKSDLAQMKIKSEGRDEEFRRLRVTLDLLLNGMSMADRHRLLRRGQDDSDEGGWSNQKAIERAQKCMDEFEETQFSRNGKALSFKDVPWPVLNDLSESNFGPRDITKKRVDKFFVEVEAKLGSEGYWGLLERMCKAFGKQRWENRGLLESVGDRQLGDELESAREVVLGAVRPLWRG
ncbi:uncharacterized protein BT62DRAFT_1075421 [Guyanagaster necrorhizus]|uniref:Uncharacterized protein n=1 Tax=Guyanagaster necrorhizus TaxID=856835 RepID=A0A9P8ATE7_9AGAR|nr:uncharacterized protein BT62DRAFT_1075421 [Guyanagaster necrorhizus MCA 3950]KAG7447363.1 hypothetical protein BT62DRAFT_1075421 [Guyanagaster necrorhizus MCA 3950]